MPLRRWLFAAVAALASAGAGGHASAGVVTFCSEFDHIVWVAIAYPQQGDNWLSRGWLELNKGDCAPFDTALSTPTFYYRAESENFRINGKRANVTWGDKGDRQFAIWEDDNFQYYNAEKRVLKSTLKQFERGMEGGDRIDIVVTLHANGTATELSTTKLGN